MKITTLLLSVGMLALVAGCSDETKMKPSKAGVRGENCQASNDCKSGLVCVSNVCSANDFPLTVEAKTCYQVIPDLLSAYSTKLQGNSGPRA